MLQRLLFMRQLPQDLFLKKEEVDALLDSLSRSFWCGVSSPFRKIEQVSRYYRQALAELVHLLHPNHGPGFYAVMDALMPDWQTRRRALRRYALERPPK